MYWFWSFWKWLKNHLFFLAFLTSQKLLPWILQNWTVARCLLDQILQNPGEGFFGTLNFVSFNAVFMMTLKRQNRPLDPAQTASGSIKTGLVHFWSKLDHPRTPSWWILIIDGRQEVIKFWFCFWNFFNNDFSKTIKNNLKIWKLCPAGVGHFIWTELFGQQNDFSKTYLKQFTCQNFVITSDKWIV